MRKERDCRRSVRCVEMSSESRVECIDHIALPAEWLPENYWQELPGSLCSFWKNDNGPLGCLCKVDVGMDRDGLSRWGDRMMEG